MEAEARIISRVAEDNRDLAAVLPAFLQAETDQICADAPPLMRGKDGQGAEADGVRQRLGSVDGYRRKKDVADDPPVFFGDERHPAGAASAKGVDQIRFPGLAEGLLVHPADPLLIPRPFPAKGDHRFSFHYK